MTKPLASSVHASASRPGARDDVFRRLENQGYRELTAAHLLAAGVALAPTIDDKQMFASHARDELSHFEAIATIYEELTGADLLALVRQRVAAVTVPDTWAELVIATFIFDLAVFHQVTGYRELSHIVLRRVVEAGLANEHAHQKAAEAVFLDLCKSGQVSAEQVEAHASRWLPLALGALDDGESLEDAEGSPRPGEVSGGPSRSAHGEVDAAAIPGPAGGSGALGAQPHAHALALATRAPTAASFLEDLARAFARAGLRLPELAPAPLPGMSAGAEPRQR